MKLRNLPIIGPRYRKLIQNKIDDAERNALSDCSSIDEGAAAAASRARVIKSLPFAQHFVG